MSRHIFLTGATGFIGSQVLAALVKAGDTVSIVVRPQSDTWRITELLTHASVRVYGESVSELERAFAAQSVDCVVHLATKYLKQHSTPAEVQELIHANVAWPGALLDVMRVYGVTKMVSTGTFFEYDLQAKAVLTETSPLKPYNVYARTKLQFDDLARDYVQDYGFSVAHLRLFAPYGPMDNPKFIPYLITNFLQGQEVHLTAGEQQWNFTYVGDIVDACQKAIDYCITAPPGHEVFNIGQAEAVSLAAVIHEIANQLGVSGLTHLDKPYPTNEIFYVSCDNTKARAQLGWTATTSIVDGLQKTIAYYKANAQLIKH